MVVRDHIVAAARRSRSRPSPPPRRRDDGSRRRRSASWRARAAYLREEATSSDARSLIPRFVSHFLEFRTDGDLASPSPPSRAPSAWRVLRGVPTRDGLVAEGVTGATVVGGIAVVRGASVPRALRHERPAERLLRAVPAQPLVHRRGGRAPRAKAACRSRQGRAREDAREGDRRRERLFGRLRQARFNRDASDDAKGNDAFLVSLPEGAKGRVIGIRPAGPPQRVPDDPSSTRSTTSPSTRSRRKTREQPRGSGRARAPRGLGPAAHGRGEAPPRPPPPARALTSACGRPAAARGSRARRSTVAPIPA